MIENLMKLEKFLVKEDLLPRTHGSGLFTRGQTQVLTLTTLGAPGEVQVLDGVIDEDDKRYMHQYNFPPFSVGDVRPLRSPGRREIGHGALAERALVPVLPSEEEFPYTMRLVSEVLSSNGSVHKQVFVAQHFHYWMQVFLLKILLQVSQWDL